MEQKVGPFFSFTVCEIPGASNELYNTLQNTLQWSFIYSLLLTNILIEQYTFVTDFIDLC